MASLTTPSQLSGSHIGRRPRSPRGTPYMSPLGGILPADADGNPAWRQTSQSGELLGNDRQRPKGPSGMEISSPTAVVENSGRRDRPASVCGCNTWSPSPTTSKPSRLAAAAAVARWPGLRPDRESRRWGAQLRREPASQAPFRACALLEGPVVPECWTLAIIHTTRLRLRDLVCDRRL